MSVTIDPEILEKAGDFNLDEISVKTITNDTNIPVIASGGVGTLDHLFDGIVKGGASAVLAASIFHYGEYSINDVKKYLVSKKIPVRV